MDDADIASPGASNETEVGSKGTIDPRGSALPGWCQDPAVGVAATVVATLLTAFSVFWGVFYSDRIEDDRPSTADEIVHAGDPFGACGYVTGNAVRDGSIQIVCGLPGEQAIEMLRLAQSPSEAARRELHRRLDQLLPASARLQADAIRQFFQILGEADIPPEHLRDRFAEIATRHLDLIDAMRLYVADDPDVQSQRERARAALDQDRPATEQAREALDSARNLIHEKRRATAAMLADRQREEAQIAREQAGLEESNLQFAAAAAFREEAAGLLPEGDRYQHWRDLLAAGRLWRDQGRDFGGPEALERAIRVYERALELMPREQAPRHWAATQNNRGIALQILGERLRDDETLARAADAFRKALAEWTRQNATEQWAMAQHNLGITFQLLAEHAPGTAWLDQAVAAFGAALGQWTRETAPLRWATVQDHRGAALAMIGERTGDVATLHEAAAAHRQALGIWTQDDHPLQWATAENNLGLVLRQLGEREADLDSLERAVASHEKVLEIWTRDRYPLHWAMVQNNLGQVLQSLGERNGGVDRLEAAEEAYRKALSARTVDDAPLDRAATLENIGSLAIVMAKRTGDEQSLLDGIEAIKTAIGLFEHSDAARDIALAKDLLISAESLLVDLKGEAAPSVLDVRFPRKVVGTTDE